MAISYSCDGCGGPVENPDRVGFVVKRDYCKVCRETAIKFLREEEELRRATHEGFIDARAALIAKYTTDGFKLPDLPT